MARADRRQAQRQARRVEQRPRAAGGGERIAEEEMFFPKLRAHAKWVFVLLAIVFAGGFIFLGVGSGSAGLGDVFSNWNDFFSSGGSSSQADEARDKIKDNPKDYAAYKDLAAAQAADGNLDEAIATLQQLKSVNPKDVDGAQQLAGLYLRKADDARTEAQAVQASSALVSPTDFTPAATSKLGEALQTTLNDPIVTAVQGQVNEKLNTAYAKMTTAFSQAVAAYKDVAKLTPSDPSIQFALAQTAEQAADTKTALAAYKRFLVLAPEDPTAPAIRQRIKQLERQGGTSVSAGG
jgi:tetratricopeptide (TPR) repeat protein